MQQNSHAGDVSALALRQLCRVQRRRAWRQEGITGTLTPRPDTIHFSGYSEKPRVAQIGTTEVVPFRQKNLRRPGVHSRQEVLANGQ